jgi:hypothetical protein
MTEIELLRELIEKERNAHDLKLYIEIWNDDEERASFIKELKHTNLEIDNLETELVKIEDKKFSGKTKVRMLEQLESYIVEINKINPTLHLSKSQSTINDNELFSGIIRDINNLVTDKISSIRVPKYLERTTDKDDSVSIQDLNDFLKNEMKILDKIEQVDFIKLLQYASQLSDRIKTQFIE